MSPIVETIVYRSHEAMEGILGWNKAAQNESLLPPSLRNMGLLARVTATRVLEGLILAVRPNQERPENVSSSRGSSSHSIVPDNNCTAVCNLQCRRVTHEYTHHNTLDYCIYYSNMRVCSWTTLLYKNMKCR